MDKLAAMRVFVKIAEAGSLSAAGRQLGLSLNSVSRQLIALEEMLGTTLVERTTRHLFLTEAGRRQAPSFRNLNEHAHRGELVHVPIITKNGRISPKRSSLSPKWGDLIMLRTMKERNGP